MKFGMKINELMPSLLSDCRRPWCSPEANACEIFNMLEIGDVWPDADLRASVAYIRGSRNLRIPPEWREFLPKFL